MKTTPNNSADNNFVKRDHLVSFLDTTLATGAIKDVSRNGLQVQGGEEIQRIALTVDACMEAYKQAVASGCQMLIAHHGIIWDGLRSITGSVYNHLKYLLDNDLNLYASHLPLDLHPSLGNNAKLAEMLGLLALKPFGWYKGMQIGFEGTLNEPVSIDAISRILTKHLDCRVSMLPFGTNNIKRVAVVSGGAAGELQEAINKGVDLFITGESSHENYHAALEAEINVIYCGHYHSEKGGVRALGELITEKFGIETVFLDIPTTI
ncbi:Nif3-like dinuclear metal center hexameric protein [Chitinispirillales bacterium ANBcel5]|uniref:Nif3-like dinuclear metal center hexameric protein n=1 Tax=Cellulosispirillum alkaliphilum TaxID=3039283 RepID=UPI002A500880|nr:Nif3-like dinuclear metal center hexameric protein [Chitinispirillales bacterium ANBcel5]